jgi:hypothetical protein
LVDVSEPLVISVNVQVPHIKAVNLQPIYSNLGRQLQVEAQQYWTLEDNLHFIEKFVQSFRKLLIKLVLILVSSYLFRKYQKILYFQTIL